MKKSEMKQIVPKGKNFIQPWMIRNLKEFGNTVVCNISKKHSQKFIQEEFAKLGVPVTVDEKGIATLIKSD